MRLTFWINKIQDALRWYSHVYWDRFRCRFLKFPEVMSIEDSIDLAVKNNMSITRFGDGELSLMCGRDLNFQSYQPELARKMEKAIRSVNKRLLVCIPDCFSEMSLGNLCSTDERFWRSHLLFFRRQWHKRLDVGRKYGNTWLSRIYSMKWEQDEALKIFSHLENLWIDRDVVIIEGAKSRIGVGNDCFQKAKSIRRILGPAKNSFSAYDQILAEAIKITGNPLFIIAMGPSATAMAYELTELGYPALDLGHLDIEFEWMRMGVKTKSPVRGKFVNEAVLTGNSDSEVIGELTAEEWQQYQSEIIAAFE